MGFWKSIWSGVVATLITAFVIWAVGIVQVWELTKQAGRWTVGVLGYSLAVPVWIAVVVALCLVAVGSWLNRESVSADPPKLGEHEEEIMTLLRAADGALLLPEDVARQLGISFLETVHALEQLLERNLVESETDRRGRVVGLTRAGRIHVLRNRGPSQ